MVSNWDSLPLGVWAGATHYFRSDMCWVMIA